MMNFVLSNHNKGRGVLKNGILDLVLGREMKRLDRGPLSTEEFRYYLDNGLHV
jgi:hypothetical protein